MVPGVIPSSPQPAPTSSTRSRPLSATLGSAGPCRYEASRYEVSQTIPPAGVNVNSGTVESNGAGGQRRGHFHFAVLSTCQ